MLSTLVSTLLQKHQQMQQTIGHAQGFAVGYGWADVRDEVFHPFNFPERVPDLIYACI